MNHSVLLLYMGSFPGKTSQLAGFRLVSPEEFEAGKIGDGSKLSFYDLRKVRKSVGHIQPGHLMKVPSEDPEGATIQLGGATYFAKWPIPGEVVRWQAEELVRERTRLAQKALKEAITGSDLYESLNLVREAYGHAVGANRVQLLAAVVAYITRG